MTTTTWTDERNARLTELWLAGYSARQIAEDLGDVTRNAVIGKINRLGLSKPTKSSITRRHKTVEREAVDLSAAVKKRGRQLRIEQLHHRACKYIVSAEDEPTLYCGELTSEGSSWCPEHRAICVERKGVALTPAWGGEQPDACRWCGSDEPGHDRKACYHRHQRDKKAASSAATAAGVA